MPTHFECGPVSGTQERARPSWTALLREGTSVEDLSDEVIAVVTEHLPRKSSPLSALLFHRLDDAYSEVGEDATACGGGRSARFQVFMVGLATTPEVLAARRHWFVLRPSRLRLLDER